MGATEEIIASLPIFRYKKKQLDDIECNTGSSLDTPSEPIICPPKKSKDTCASVDLLVLDPSSSRPSSLGATRTKKKRFRLLPAFFKKSDDAPASNTVSEEIKFLELPEDNSLCSICISDYDEGDDLRQLNCGHHYHVACIDEWLRKNAKCPLCKGSVGAANS
jgi:hypothetical protein